MDIEFRRRKRWLQQVRLSAIDYVWDLPPRGWHLRSAVSIQSLSEFARSIALSIGRIGNVDRCGRINEYFADDGQEHLNIVVEL